MVTLESLPAACLKPVDLYVMADEYQQYRGQWYGGLVRKIHKFPETMDCLSKKKKHFYQEIDGPYMLIDDDLFLFAWSVKEQRFVKAKESERLFTRRFLEELPEVFDSFNMVSCVQRSMAGSAAARKGWIAENRLGSAMAGYAANRPQDVWFNKILFTLDQPLPIQNFQRTKSSVEYLGIAFNQSWAKVLSTSGTAAQRSAFLAMNDALKCVQLFPGIVTDFVKNHSIKGDLALHRKPSRIPRGVRPDHEAESTDFVRRFLAHNGLRRAPKIFDYEDLQPFKDIVNQVETNWVKAGGSPNTFLFLGR